jgi:hypothetical protein
MQRPLLPTRIETAFRALAYTHTVEVGGVTMTPRGPQAGTPRSLSAAESSLRNSAIEVLRNFITGEIRVPEPRTRRPNAGNGVAAKTQQRREAH